MASASRTRYATTSGVDIAYQVLGEGPIDLLLFAGYSIPIDCMKGVPGAWRLFSVDGRRDRATRTDATSSAASSPRWLARSATVEVAQRSNAAPG